MKTRPNETKQATKRFLDCMNDVINKHKQEGGKIVNVKEFAVSIGLSPQNFSKYNTKDQHISTPILVKSCKLYRMNPTYIILGEGLPFLDTHYVDKIKQLEERVKKLEALIK